MKPSSETPMEKITFGMLLRPYRAPDLIGAGDDFRPLGRSLFSDMPAIRRHPALARLDALAGAWTMHAAAGGREVMRGRTTGEWIEDGAFLRLRADADPPSADTHPDWITHSPFPTTVVIALDDASQTFTYAYSDGRGVSRVYTMRLEGDRWEIDGRPGADFFQRFRAVIAGDARTILGRWERSDDGERWELDFELEYRRAEA
jgi:hypothetical protein